MLCAGAIFLTSCGESSQSSEEEQYYYILLLDENETSVLYSAKVEEGEVIENVPTPTKAATSEYTYSFAGWVDGNGNRVILSFARSDITAYATYTATAREYSLTVMANSETTYSYNKVSILLDGVQLTSGSTVHYGDLLQITINGTEGYDVTDESFSGLQKVEQDGQTYYKVVGDVTISYTDEASSCTVSVLSYDKTTSLGTITTTYGNNISSQLTIPTRSATVRASYSFDCWRNIADDTAVDVTKITSTMTIYASYTEQLIAYTLTIGNTAKVSVFNGDEEVFNGDPIYYGDTLTVVTNTPTGYHITALTATSEIDGQAGDVTDISTQNSFKVVGNMTVLYDDSINTYTVTLYVDGSVADECTVDYGTDMTTSAYSTALSPVKAKDETYTYDFEGWVDKDGVAIDLTNITSNITAFAVFGKTYIEYSVSLTKRVSLNITSGQYSGTAYTCDSESPTIHYGDTFTVSYDLADGYSVNTLTYNGENISSGEAQTVSTEDGVSIVFAMQKTFEAVAYQNLQRIVGFSGSDGTYIDVEYNLNTGKISNTSTTLVDGGSIISYTYVGLEEITYTGDYADFISMSGLTLYSGQSYTPTYKNGVYTTAGMSSVGKIDVPLYKGMVIEFTISGTMAQLNFGLSTSDRIENAMLYTFLSGSTYYFSPEYNIWSYSTGSYLSSLIITQSSTTDSETGEVTSYASYANKSLNKNYSLFGTIDVTIKIVLADTMQLYINNELISFEDKDSDVSNFVIDEYNTNTPYYFTLYAHGTHSITFTEFGYYENSELGYLKYLSGKTLTIVGDSITAGSGASNVYEEVDQTTAECDSTVTYYYMDADATTTNSDGYAYVTELEAFDSDITYYIMTSSKTEHMYANVLNSALGTSLTNLGLSNSGYCTGRTNSNGDDLSRLSIIEDISTNSEIIVIFLGINDIRNSSESWGTLDDSDITSTNTTTMYGAINTMYSAIISLFEDEGKEIPEIYVCSPTPDTSDLDGTRVWGGGYTLQELCAALEERASYYGFNFIDLLNTCGFTEDYYVDSVHPNNDGHAAIASLIYDAIIENSKYTYNIA